MNFHQLTLHNFGAYVGRHSFDLTVESGKPIVLFLGLNGSGKTTILTALQLILFGQHSEPALDFGERSGCSYQDYLRGWVNHSVDADEGASLELEFTHTLGGVQRKMKIVRAWRQHAARRASKPKKEQSAGADASHAEESVTIREAIDVLIDGQRDNHLSTHWDDSFDEFLPRKLAPLFFFDGEKLDAWSSGELRVSLISETLQELLGLEVIDRTLADLAAMQREYTKSAVPPSVETDLQAHRNAIAQKEDIIATLVQQEAQANDEVLRREKMLRKAETNLEQKGGRLWQQRSELQALLSAAESRLNLARQQLHMEKMDKDRRRRDWTDFLQLTRDRDTALLASLPEEFHSAVSAVLDTHTLPILPPELVRKKGGSRKEEGSDTPGALRDPAGVFKDASAEVSRLKDLLSRVPEDFEITPLLADRDGCGADLQQASFRLYEISGQLTRHRTEVERAKAMLQREAEASVRELRQHQAAIRSLADCGAVRKELMDFRQSLVERHTAAIASLFTEHYQGLLHKKNSLFDRAVLLPVGGKSGDGPTRFGLTLIKGGDIVDPDRFSAGEKQLLAIALIWSLAQTANISAPVVIDTPLGRLDSAHRKAVIEDYLPQAAEQVLVFSTDEEIEPEKHPNLPMTRVIRLEQLHRLKTRKKRLN